MAVLPIGPRFSPSIALVGEAPSREDVLQNHPFAGVTGAELDRLLFEAGISRAACYITYVYKELPPKDNKPPFKPTITRLFRTSKKQGLLDGASLINGRWAMPLLQKARDSLHKELIEVNPELIITLGDAALWAVAGESGITKWRGSQLHCLINELAAIPTLATYSPAAVVAKYDWRFPLLQDLKRATQWITDGLSLRDDYIYHIRPSLPDALKFLHSIQKQLDEGPTLISVDIETRHQMITCIGFATSSYEAMCIPITSVEKGSGYWSPEAEERLVLLMKKILEHPNACILGQNFSYDYYYLAMCWGIRPRVTEDTMTKHHTIFCALPKNLGFLSSLYCAYHRYWKDEGKDFHNSIKTPEDEDKYWTYNCKDCVTTYEISEELEPVLDATGQRDRYYEQMNRFLPIINTTLRGVKQNLTLKKKYALALMDSYAEREKILYHMLGQEINISSPKQMTTLFYEDFALKVIKNRKSGNATADADALQVIAKREPLLKPVCDLIEEMRSIGVFLSTFVNAALDPDGRIRCSYNLDGTTTFRFSSSKNPFGTGANLQNMPKGTEK